MILIAIPLACAAVYLALLAAWEFWDWFGSVRLAAEIVLVVALLACLGDL